MTQSILQRATTAVPRRALVAGASGGIGHAFCQQLAGVGTDPRGRRQFNIAKQQREYDPAGEFIQRYYSR